MHPLWKQCLHSGFEDHVTSSPTLYLDKHIAQDIGTFLGVIGEVEVPLGVELDRCVDDSPDLVLPLSTSCSCPCSSVVSPLFGLDSSTPGTNSDAVVRERGGVPTELFGSVLALKRLAGLLCEVRICSTQSLLMLSRLRLSDSFSSDCWTPLLVLRELVRRTAGNCKPSFARIFFLSTTYYSSGLEQGDLKIKAKFVLKFTYFVEHVIQEKYLPWNIDPRSSTSFDD